MSKYIDAEKLIAEIERLYDIARDASYNGEIEGEMTAYDKILSLITSLQQEQPEVQNGKFVFPKYLYARTKDNKTIDMSYAPQDMTAVEYVRNDFVEQEQPDVELEIERIVQAEEKFMNFQAKHQLIGDVARHFYELGLNARK